MASDEQKKHNDNKNNKPDNNRTGRSDYNRPIGDNVKGEVNTTNSTGPRVPDNAKK